MKARTSKPACILVSALLAVLSLATAVEASEPAAQEGIPYSQFTQECQTKLVQAEAHLREHASELDFSGGIDYVLRVAGDACDLSLELGASGPPPAIKIENLPSPSCGSLCDIPLLQPCEECPREYLTPDLSLGADIVECSVPGEGTGTIVGVVLGVPLNTVAAVGEWTPKGEGIQVAGDGGTLGGIQTGNVGTMLLGPLPIPSLQGETSATCAEVSSEVVLEEECFWLVFWWKCTRKTETSIDLVPCGATAKQHALTLNLAYYEHTYGTGESACA